MAARNEKLAAEKRRQILDAAVRVFARQGFNQCRVRDIADEAGVAYGLVYHYFRSKDEVLDTLFLERWNVMLDVIRDLDGQDLAPRDKLYAIASFIIDSYRHDPDLMKVIIVEVTRAANSFGQTHLEKITEAYELIAGIVERGAGRGGVQGHGHAASSRRWPSTARSSRSSRAGSSGPCRAATPSSRKPRRSWWRLSAAASTLLPQPLEIGSRQMENEMVKRLVWSGLLAGLGALASIATTRVAAMIWRRVFGEDPPE